MIDVDRLQHICLPMFFDKSDVVGPSDDTHCSAVPLRGREEEDIQNYSKIQTDK